MGPMKVGAAVAAMLILAGPAALACQGSKILFEDHFADFQPTWGTADEELGVEDGRLVIKPEADLMLWAPNTASLYDDVDLCATVTTIEAVDPEVSFAGLVFWYLDDDNFYTVQIDANGFASMWRRQRGRWLVQVEWEETDLAKPGDGAANDLRVVTDGNAATYYINGQEFKKISGQPPDGQQIGVIAFSPEDGVSSYAFADFVVTEPE